MDDNQQTAATMIYRFIVRERLGDDFNSINAVATKVLNFTDARQLSGFLEGRINGDRDGAEVRENIEIIVNKAKELFENLRDNSGYFADSKYKNFHIPSCVRLIYNDAFNRGTGNQETNTNPYEKAFDELAGLFGKTAVNYQTLRILKNKVASNVYDVYRWTSPSMSKAKSRAIRASLCFLHPTSASNFIRFHLHYKPYDPGEDKKPSVTNGLVIPIGEYIYMVGIESNTFFPLVICARVDLDNVDKFRGLVLRKPDRVGPVFAARVVFQRNTNAKELSDLDKMIGIIPQYKLTSGEKALLEEVINLPKNAGKQALTLT